MDTINRKVILETLNSLQKKKTELVNKGAEMCPSSRIPTIALINRQIQHYKNLLAQC